MNLVDIQLPNSGGNYEDQSAQPYRNYLVVLADRLARKFSQTDTLGGRCWNESVGGDIDQAQTRRVPGTVSPKPMPSWSAARRFVRMMGNLIGNLTHPTGSFPRARIPKNPASGGGSVSRKPLNLA